MNTLLTLFRQAYAGLSASSWILALVMFVNRSGSMVVPFLSLYLTNQLGLSLKDAGLIMSLFGAGAMIGAFGGGWLTDKSGHFFVQLFSLVGTAILLMVMLNVNSYFVLCLNVFSVGMVAECLRPANAASIAVYAKPENITRAFSLNRMSVNLGFAIGPALGGLQAAVSFTWLFIADALTCLFAAVLFFLYFYNRRHVKTDKSNSKSRVRSRSAWQDIPFLFFVFLTCCYGTMLFLLFTILPLYYRDEYYLSETMIGLLIGVNGLVIFLVEMVFVFWIGQRISGWILIILGILLTELSYVVLNWSHSMPVLFISMMMLSFAEILVMPYMATITTHRAKPETMGSYMGLYTLAYSAAFVAAPYFGSRIVSSWGYNTLWYACGILCLFTSIGFYLLQFLFNKQLVKD